MPEAREEIVEERVLREQPDRLIMIKRRTWKEDGRTLIYYDFCREAPDSTPERSDAGIGI
ncbi:MAG: hypothetical protein HY320_04205 [Armatimonadetes bacterium]|nr:hypothetical protein [Armatimonadota bacterium]